MCPDSRLLGNCPIRTTPGRFIRDYQTGSAQGAGPINQLPGGLRGNSPLRQVRANRFLQHPRRGHYSCRQRQEDGRRKLRLGRDNPNKKDWPVFDLYADTSGWLVAFLPKDTVDDRANKSSVAYMLSQQVWDTYTSSTSSWGDWPRYDVSLLNESTIGTRALVALARFVYQVPDWDFQDLQNYRLYHFQFPRATAIHVAAEHTDSMSFFIPEALTVEEASFAFWAEDFQQENSLSIDGENFYENAETNKIGFNYLDLHTGRHEIQVSGNLMLAITVRE